jgi:acetyltransferase-like isoleucine patch superfamily enzyme
MYLVELFYKKILNVEPPYYAKYSLFTIMYKPIRKFLNVVIIPNIPFSKLRIFLYRAIGFKIGKNVFIGMKCYLDDVDPSKIIIEDNVSISYGVYFVCHGKKQKHTYIIIKKGAYIGMRANLISGKKGIIIGENAIVGAGSLVNKSVPDNKIAVGVPIKIIGENK